MENVNSVCWKIFAPNWIKPHTRGKFLCSLAFSNISGQLWTCIFMGPSQFRPSCCDSGTMYLQWTSPEIHLWKQAQEDYLLFVLIMINTFWNVNHCLCYIISVLVSASAENRFAMSGGPSHDFDSPCQSWIFSVNPDEFNLWGPKRKRYYSVPLHPSFVDLWN